MVNSQQIKFESATTEDVDAFIALERKVKNPAIYGPTLETGAAINEITRNRLFFIRLDGVVVGMAAYRQTPEGSIYISNVNVDPAHHRKGLARAAMNFVLEKNKNAARIELVTHPTNTGALGLYTSLGFEVEGRKENYFGDGEPRLLLAKTG